MPHGSTMQQAFARVVTVLTAIYAQVPGEDKYAKIPFDLKKLINNPRAK